MLKRRFLIRKLKLIVRVYEFIISSYKMIDYKLASHEPVRKITPNKSRLHSKKKETGIHTLTKFVVEYHQGDGDLRSGGSQADLAV